MKKHKNKRRLFLHWTDWSDWVFGLRITVFGDNTIAIQVLCFVFYY